MSVELRPYGVACNLGCTYCYQQPQRDAGNVTQPYDLERMKAAVERNGGPFVLFGGEPLLLPIADLEDLWKWGFEKWGRNSVQTNGLLIGDEHIRLFRRYNVNVGISIDGPGELNDARRLRNIEETRQATALIEAAIERVAREWRAPGLIVTLHRLNATGDALPRMRDWFERLAATGIRSVRLHLLEVDDPAVGRDLALDDRENVAALLFFAEVQEKLPTLRFDVIEEMRNLVLGDDRNAACVWRACDPYTTPAVQGVEGDGQSSNCGRTNKEGVGFTKSDEVGFERYLMLYQTPQEHGGCRGCRFFLMCKGQCPGTAIDGDWRNRTEHCAIWKALFTRIERALVREGKYPITLQPVRHRLERNMLHAWRNGRGTTLGRLSRAELTS